MPARPSFWTLQYREAKTQAILGACILWIAAVMLAFWGDGYRSVLGPLKGGDFVHFYTLGHQVRHGSSHELYDAVAQYRLQTRLVPESGGEHYFPVYPPQTALVFAPLAGLSYGLAALSWAAITIALYGLIVGVAVRRSFPSFQDPLFAVAAAAAFPPVWQLVLHGQTTILPLTSFCLGWLALERRRPFLAGIALGFLALKPQFGLALAVVVLAGGEWAILGGAVVSVLVQAIGVAAILGAGAIQDFVQMLQRLPEFAAALEPKPHQLHSLKALADLLPGWLGTGVWIAAGAVVLVWTVRSWLGGAPVAVRLGVVVVATVLISPHLTVYDLTVLALPLVWFGGWLEREANEGRTLRGRYWGLVYGLCLLVLLPVAHLTRLQPSVILMTWLFYLIAKASSVAVMRRVTVHPERT